MNKYAVIGNPIKHSQSPRIHAVFAQQEKVDIDYQRILANEDNFTTIVKDFFTGGGQGLNVTVPFKMLAYQQCAQLNDYAKAAKAVNTISLNEEQQWVGFNTDGVGLLRDLKQNLKLSIENKNILILGAGGAARGILLPLLQENPAKVKLANRTIDKAIELASSFNQFGSIEGCGFNQIGCKAFDIVINATSASLDNTLPPIADSVVSENTVCYDLAYSHEPTAFITWAKRQGVIQAHDGIGMLIEQAAESYYIWRGFKPKTQEAINMLTPPD